MTNKYQYGKIYSIRNHLDNDIYIGSTTTALSNRMVKHRHDMNRFNMKISKKMKEIGVDNFYIELVEEYPCDNIEQLRKKEGEYIRQMGTLNTRIEQRTIQEYYLDTIDKRTEYNRINREEILRKKKEYHKKNIEIIRAKDNERYHANKETIYEKSKEWKSTKVECVCGGCYTKAHKAEHEKSKKHINNINKE